MNAYNVRPQNPLPTFLPKIDSPEKAKTTGTMDWEPVTTPNRYTLFTLDSGLHVGFRDVKSDQSCQQNVISALRISCIHTIRQTQLDHLAISRLATGLDRGSSSTLDTHGVQTASRPCKDDAR